MVEEPQSAGEPRAGLIQTEGAPPSPPGTAPLSQLYHQVPGGIAPHDSPLLRRCRYCGHRQPTTASPRPEHCPITDSPRPDRPPAAVRTALSCSSSPAPSGRDTVHCHWLQGSHDSRNHQPVQHHVVTVRHESQHRIPRSYSQLIADWPKAVLITCAVVFLAFSLAGVLIGPLPDFSDPLSGFEPRGTEIGTRMHAWSKLQESTEPGKLLSLSPNQSFLSLWSLSAIHSMCKMDQERIRSHSHFQNLCLRQGGEGGQCCPSWSLGNYLAALENVTCEELSEQQLSDRLQQLRRCAPYYHQGSLAPACGERGKPGRCSSVPDQCKSSSAIYQILHYLVDKDFLGPQTTGYQVPSLKYSLLILPLGRGDSLMDIYLQNLEGWDLRFGTTAITGMDLGIKKQLFCYYLVRDLVYPLLGAVTLVLATALYLRSLLLAVVTLGAVLGSLGVSYFFYKLAFRLTFFPFLNLAAVLVLLGSCANQAFTFSDLWGLQLSQKPPALLDKRVSRVLHEAGYLTVVSGLTSSAAFYSGYLSSITAVRCFSLYLGTATLVSSLAALVWLPCSLVLRERYSHVTVSPRPAGRVCCAPSSGGFWDSSSRKRCLFSLARKMRSLSRGMTSTSDLLFLKVLPCGVVKFRYIWVCWFTTLAAGGTYITCVDPGMKLPVLESQATQLFRSSHPFERYDAEYRHQFMFQRLQSGEEKPMVVTLVWGVLPVDNGDHLDPRSTGSLVMDPDFNMSSPEAQVWLLELCGRTRNQSFYWEQWEGERDRGESVCLVERLVRWMSSRQCSLNDNDNGLCCNHIPFPYRPAVFQHCLGIFTAERREEEEKRGLRSDSGSVRFDSEGRAAALALVFGTTYRYSFNYNQTALFYQEIDAWFLGEMSGAPPGLRGGWFVSHLGLYDLQQCLSSETLVVMGFSVALVFTTLLLTTWNVLLSVYGAAAVGGSVFVTAGLLVLLEWQLSGLEALFISAAAGLSVDFAANYCVSYSLSPHSDRLGRVAHSLKRMGCPVALGAGSYFCAGILMLPATALVFRKLGIFLLLVKCVACGFATFFFQSLCCFCGPQKNCGQILWPCAAAGVDAGGHNTKQDGSAPGAAATRSAANGAFGCRSRARRSFGKGGGRGGEQLCQNQQKQGGGGGGRGRGGEEEHYELQPLARQLSDSFENSTCTSKLSNRPSVLSEEIQFRGLSPRRTVLGRSGEEEQGEAGRGENRGCHLHTCPPPPALQTSSPYRENLLRPMASAPPLGDQAQDRLLCRRCQGQTGGLRHWRATSLSSSSSMEDITQRLDSRHPSVSDEGGAAGSSYQHHPHRRLLSSQSQSSFDGLEDSNETCLSDMEGGPPTPLPPAKPQEEGQPGHLNGKRDTLRLALRETVFDEAPPVAGRGRASHGEQQPVILPNSKPDLPDVWIRREEEEEEGRRRRREARGGRTTADGD
ncbi:Protein dispatched-like 2 [Acipenser ruthenus]|uniref:Protein dispatched-like 2 n=1 Tax=Acipenser ruthenus TaxID=7906 RepID=A0A444UW80_ACIRT|nr:Protein dispatched-like 2 [Acipenser ruthenus]